MITNRINLQPSIDTLLQHLVKKFNLTDIRIDLAPTTTMDHTWIVTTDPVLSKELALKLESEFDVLDNPFASFKVNYEN